jgi:hypothetical protein
MNIVVAIIAAGFVAFPSGHTSERPERPACIEKCNRSNVAGGGTIKLGARLRPSGRASHHAQGWRQEGQIGALRQITPVSLSSSRPQRNSGRYRPASRLPISRARASC